MIDFLEIGNFEVFEDFCADLFSKMGLHVRRLGRGPGQLGKDVILHESIISPVSEPEVRKWLVECKYTEANKSISERDIFNVADRLKAQKAYGYILFTNARLTVNLEKTLSGLKACGDIGIDIWTSDKIINYTVVQPDVYRNYFPLSYKKALECNQLLLIKKVQKYKSPLVDILSHLRLIKNYEDRPITTEGVYKIIEKLENDVNSIIESIDKDIEKSKITNFGDR